MIISIVLLGLVLRLISLNQSLWLDEATSLLVAGNFSFVEIITKFAPGDFHPPFYYLLLKGWVLVFGSGEIPARLLSVFMGVATVGIIYLIGRELGGRRVGVTAALFLATSPLHIYYSQEARMYALAAIFVALAVFSYMKTFKDSRVGYWALFTFSIVAAIATDYLPIFLLPVFWLYKGSKKLLVSHIILGILGLTWLPVFVKQLSGGLLVSTTSPSWWNILGTSSVKNLALVPVKFMIGRMSFDNKTLYAFIVAMASLLFGLLIFKAIQVIKKVSFIRLMLLWLIVPVLLVALVSLKVPMLSYFRLLFVLPALYLLVAVGANQLKPVWQKSFIGVLVAINLAASGFYLTNVKFQREDWRGLVSYVETQKSKDSITFFPADSQMEAYKYYSPDATIAGPEGFNKKYQEIWLMRYVQPIFDPVDNLRTKIETSGYKKIGEYDFNGVVVWRYQK